MRKDDTPSQAELVSLNERDRLQISLAMLCHCAKPVKNRSYGGEFECRLCGKTITPISKRS